MNDLELWLALRSKIIQHMFDRNAEAFFYLSTENARQMKTVYSRYNNLQDMIDDLDYRIGMAENGFRSGAIFTSVGGQN
jgi:hypothetical protein